MARSSPLSTAEALADTCTLCGSLVLPRDIQRLDSDRSRCPHCGGTYTYATPGLGQTTGGPTRPEEHTYGVYMAFERSLDVWRVTLRGPGRMRVFTFAENSKLEQMAERGKAFRTLADRQGFEQGVRQGRGGVTLHLTRSQLAAVRL